MTQVKTKNKGTTFSILLSIGLLCSLFIFSQWYTKNETPVARSIILDNKQGGVHVFGGIDIASISILIQHNFDWITFVPFGDQKDFDSPTMNYYKGDSLEMHRRDSIWQSKIGIAHAAGLKVHLKPHVWIYAPTKGKWRSDIFPTNEENWKQWQKNYREFILLYAKIAEKNKVELFCIGTELTRLTLEKPAFWKGLIKEVRSIYTGEITYAANWYKEYEKINFWKELDYIGVQAYFPLVKNKYPSLEQISKAWNKHLPSLEATHKKYNRKILFTEMGYKSTADSAIKPWEWIDYESDKNKLLSNETQANCYQAFYNTIWKKDWFAGVHIWDWRSDFVKGRGKNYLDFTPQGKPAANIITKGFEKK